MFDQETLKWNEDGLIPAIAQDAGTGEVLMMAWMNREALDKTLATKACTYYSRSRKQLWRKGETSGNTQEVLALSADCDGDCLLVTVKQTGPACHTGMHTCFHQPILAQEEPLSGPAVLKEVYDVIVDRTIHPKEGSYTNYLFEKGIDKMCKKVGEEAAEVIIAAKNNNPDELRYEAADLLYHLMVVMVKQGLTWDDLFMELNKRR